MHSHVTHYRSPDIALVGAVENITDYQVPQTFNIDPADMKQVAKIRRGMLFGACAVINKTRLQTTPDIKKKMKAEIVEASAFLNTNEFTFVSNALQAIDLWGSGDLRLFDQDLVDFCYMMRDSNSKFAEIDPNGALYLIGDLACTCAFSTERMLSEFEYAYRRATEMRIPGKTPIWARKHYVTLNERLGLCPPSGEEEPVPIAGIGNHTNVPAIQGSCGEEVSGTTQADLDHAANAGGKPVEPTGNWHPNPPEQPRRLVPRFEEGHVASSGPGMNGSAVPSSAR